MTTMPEDGMKTFNLHFVNEELDQVLAELGQAPVQDAPEIVAAVQIILTVKELIRTFSDRMRNEPFKGAKLTSGTDYAMGVANALLYQLKIWWDTYDKLDINTAKRINKMVDNAESSGIISKEAARHIDEAKNAYVESFDHLKLAVIDINKQYASKSTSLKKKS